MDVRVRCPSLAGEHGGSSARPSGATTPNSELSAVQAASPQLRLQPSCVDKLKYLLKKHVCRINCLQGVSRPEQSVAMLPGNNWFQHNIHNA